ncbi:MAG: signal peptidase I [Desulfurococcaceae archaeon]
MNERTKHIALTIITIAMLIAIIIFIYYSYLVSPVIAVVKGESMLPLFREGDLVFINKVKPDEVKVGDIIVYSTRGGSLIIHRVIEVVVEDNTYYYVTKGDNNTFPDFIYFENGKGIPYTRVVGKILTIGDNAVKIPYIGHLALIFRGG